MMSDRHRILELALESLEIKKKEIDREIEEMKRELKGLPARPAAAVKATPAAAPKAVAASKKRPRFTRAERLRRSQRMKAYWENWRKKKSAK